MRERMANVADPVRPSRAGVEAWHLSMSLRSFSVALGMGWDLPGDAPVHLRVGRAVPGQAEDAHCDRLNEYFVPAGYGPAVADQYLVVRAACWEFYPQVRFHAACASDLGARFRLGELRRFWAEVVQEVLATHALDSEEAVFRAQGEPVHARFAGRVLVLEFSGGTLELQGEE